MATTPTLETFASPVGDAFTVGGDIAGLRLVGVEGYFRLIRVT